VERSRSSKGAPERLIIGEKKYIYIMPEQIKIIVAAMLKAVKSKLGKEEDGELTLNFKEFRTFLDLNPALRSMVRESMKPDLWSINLGDGKGGSGGGFGCFAPTKSSAKKLGEAPERKK